MFLQLHQESHLTNVFLWKDGKSKIDYDYFGDVVFDTSYHTNKYNLIMTAYKIDVFSAGIKSSPRSESKNSVLGDIVGKTTSLTQFLATLEKIMMKRR